MKAVTKGLKLLTLILGIYMIVGFGTPVMAAQKTAAGNVYQAVFDADYYYNTYPDLQAAIGKNNSKLYAHFVNYGIKEGRSGCSDFNINVYKANNPDLVTLFGGDSGAYCRHYADFGKAEGRIASDGSSQAGNIQAGSTPAAVQDDNVIASYTTYYETGIPRASNIELAVSRLNGTVIAPGAEFSFSNTILPRTTVNGYVPGPAYSSGKVIQSVGGGICQVSSTLYAAMLTGAIPATERHAHSMPVPYLPTGMDATIAGTWKDLKFVNQQGGSVMIQASAVNGALTVTLSRV